MILVTGAGGQLGQALQPVLAGRAVVYKTSAELDITDAEACRKLVADQGISLILNAAAYTKVDKAESEHDLAFAVNREGALNLARAAHETGAKVVHISTDYVFDGSLDRPYVETDLPNPQTVYGRSKLAGEDAVLEHAPAAAVLRTGWLYSGYGHNFMKTMLRLGVERESLNVVDDQTGTPTLADSLARAMVRIGDELLHGGEMRELFHYAGGGETTWCGFARAIMEQAALPCEIKAITTDEYPTAAVRPAYSVLDTTKLKSHFGLPINHWRDELTSCLTHLTK
ncbi:MAG: dTDP-4-dehydrorhamnose reductase [Blastochloris viridis]|uniref:dTDP-4-dehydrorhamnose reductase n=1 Tax=Blastochloris viridis TaxID=1079 RepID=A0A6N4R1U7_BLAVI|nr:MAG: dTDP-4-dehydrorhamnose reductase [Blastochloris viridis]